MTCAWTESVSRSKTSSAEGFRRSGTGRGKGGKREREAEARRLSQPALIRIVLVGARPQVLAQIKLSIARRIAVEGAEQLVPEFFVKRARLVLESIEACISASAVSRQFFCRIEQL